MMNFKKITPIIIENWDIQLSKGSISEAIKEVREQMIFDTCQKMFKSGYFNSTIIVGDENFQKKIEKFNFLIFEKIEKDFNFGKSLLKIINKYSLDKIFYFGAGSCYFLNIDELKFISEKTVKGQFISNNLVSSDFISFSSSDLNREIILNFPNIDNYFSSYLMSKTSLKYLKMPVSLGSIFDIDTPNDIAILSKITDNSGRVGEYISNSIFKNIDLNKFIKILSSKSSEIFVYGRINPLNLYMAERNIPCKIRFLSEERGLKIRGRASASLLEYIFQSENFDIFFKLFENICDGGIFDTRAVFSLFAGEYEQEDLYLSDMKMWEKIKNPFIKSFTKRVSESELPIILGGHSVVNGGLMALSNLVGGKKYDSSYMSRM